MAAILMRPAPARLVPHVAGRFVAAGVVVVALAAVHLRYRPVTLCPLRSLTGVPCPFCGGTTAAVELGRGHVLDALRASPLAVGLIAGWPFARVWRPPDWWARTTLRHVLITLVLVGSELWQLQRFHWFGA